MNPDKKELELVKNFFNITGGQCTVMVEKILEKTILVSISGFELILPHTPHLLRKSLAEVGHILEVCPSKNPLGMSFIPEPYSMIINDDNIFTHVIWRKRHYLAIPPESPFTDKKSIYQIEPANLPLPKLVKNLIRFCGMTKNFNTPLYEMIPNRLHC